MSQAIYAAINPGKVLHALLQHFPTTDIVDVRLSQTEEELYAALNGKCSRMSCNDTESRIQQGSIF